MRINKSKNLSPSLVAKKIGYGTAATAVWLAPGLMNQADADVVHVTTPVSISFGGGSVPWDIDGGGTAEFNLSTFSFFGSFSMSINNAAVSNGANFVIGAGGTTDDILNLGPVSGGGSRADIGPTLAPAYAFGGSSYFNRNLLYVTASLGNATFDSNAIGFTDGVAGFIGFKFVNDTTLQTNYGWASLTIDLGNPSLSINEWAYDNMGNPIHVGDTGRIPEPSGLGGLALLALGAAGVRRRKQQSK